MVQVSVLEKKACRRKLQIKVPAKEVDKQYEEAMAIYQKQAKVPGFRAGRAPRNLVEARYSKKIYEQLPEDIVPRAYHEAMEKEKFTVAKLLDVSESIVEKGKPFAFEVTLDIVPTFKLPKYKGIKIKAENKAVTDDDVEEALSNLLERFTKFEVVEGRPVQEKDVVSASFVATYEGKPLEDQVPKEAISAVKNENAWVSADDKEFLPGLGVGLIGASVGETKEIEIVFPEDFHVKELAKKKALYQVEVKEIRERIAPELNEELLQQIGAESEETLRVQLRTDLEAQAETQEENRRKDEILKMLSDKVNFDLPESVVQEETKNAVYDMIAQNRQYGVPEETLTENKEQIFEAASKNAASNLKTGYILERIADEEKVEASAKDISESILRMSQAYRMTPAELRADLEKRGVMDLLAKDVQKRKTVDFLLQEATIVEKK